MKKTNSIIGLSLALLLASCGGSSSSASQSSFSTSQSSSSEEATSISGEASSSSVVEESSEELTMYDALDAFLANLANTNQTSNIYFGDSLVGSLKLIGDDGFFSISDYEDEDGNVVEGVSGVGYVPSYGYFNLDFADGEASIGEMRASSLCVDGIAQYITYSALDIAALINEKDPYDGFTLSDDSDMVFEIDLKSKILTASNIIAVGASYAEEMTITAASLTLSDSGNTGEISVAGAIIDGEDKYDASYRIEFTDFGSTNVKAYDEFVATNPVPSVIESWEETGVEDYLDTIWGENHGIKLPFYDFSAGFFLNSAYVSSQNLLGILDLGLAEEGVDGYKDVLVNVGWTLDKEQSNASKHDYYLTYPLNKEEGLYATASLSLQTYDEGTSGAVLFPEGYFAMALSTWVAPIEVEGFDNVVSYIDEALANADYSGAPSLGDYADSITKAGLLDYTNTYIEAYNAKILAYYVATLTIENSSDAEGFVSSFAAALVEAGYEYSEAYFDYGYAGCYFSLTLDKDDKGAYAGTVTLTLEIDFANPISSSPDAANALLSEIAATSGHSIPSLPDSELPTSYTVNDYSDYASMIDALYWVEIHIAIDESDADGYLGSLCEAFSSEGWQIYYNEESGEYTATSLDQNATATFYAATEVIETEDTYERVYSGFIALELVINAVATPIDSTFVNSLIAEFNELYGVSVPNNVSGEVFNLNYGNGSEGGYINLFLTYEDSDGLNEFVESYKKSLIEAGYTYDEEKGAYSNELGSSVITIESDAENNALYIGYEFVSVVYVPGFEDVSKVITAHNKTYNANVPLLPEVEGITVESLSDNEESEGKLPVYIFLGAASVDLANSYTTTYVGLLIENGFTLVSTVEEDDGNWLTYRNESGNCEVEVDINDYGEDIGVSVCLTITYFVS